ncbi:MAG: hypothetical protein U0P81_14750 [Holophagaceae bacterium]
MHPSQGRLGNPLAERSLLPIRLSARDAPLDILVLRCGGYHTLSLTCGRKLLACGRIAFGQPGGSDSPATPCRGTC